MAKIYNNTKLTSSAIYSQVYWHDFFVKEDIDRIVQYCKTNDLNDSTVSNNAVLDNKTRISKVNFHNPNAQNQWIFDRINFGVEDINNKFFHFDLYGYDYFQYSEYEGEKLGKYNFHGDMFINDESLSQPLTRKLSLSLLLSEPGVDFEGGEFQINSGLEQEAKTLEMRKGSLVAFPSFMIHRVAPVTKGVRRSIVLWVVGPKFK
ncbi:MAG: 2OG-Fe(II) oxygenase [Pelagibacterales bacterium]|nr:2OG-Fe(II) oxygenase [Pelagibacterales bacterium]